MRILLTGGTGLIGQALCQYWLTQGHELFVWSRRPEQVPDLCGEGVQGFAHLKYLQGIKLDAVINLAGAPIADRRWTRQRKTLLMDSRVRLTNELVQWLGTLTHRPEVLVSGSAVGWYGDAKEKILTEADPVITRDFGSQLCQAWELAAQPASDLGIRVVTVRTGLVLSTQGGLLKRLLLPFKLGLGTRLGSGQHWMPWLHLADQVRLIDFLMLHPNAYGPYNACAPTPVRNTVFTQSIAAAVHRPTFLVLPEMALRVGFGEMATILTSSQHALPAKLQQAGFSFQFTELPAALNDLLTKAH
ncbi:TIGR01777 family oxidoreductase [Paenalcaligenes hominis]|uniref:TIGR01777 family oxidoreductase n=1 Tax=Paenalcaligenes hominis TaxID=643674 RepID=UPI00352686CA